MERNSNLASVAHYRGLDKCMAFRPLSPNSKSVADALEAIIGAVWDDAKLRYRTRDAQFETVSKVVHRLGLLRLALRYDHVRHAWRDLEMPTSRRLFPAFFSGHYLAMIGVLPGAGTSKAGSPSLFSSNYLHMVDVSTRTKANIIGLRDVWGNIDVSELLHKAFVEERAPRAKQESWWQWLFGPLSLSHFRRSAWTPTSQNKPQETLGPLREIYTRILERTVPLPSSPFGLSKFGRGVLAPDGNTDATTQAEAVSHTPTSSQGPQPEVQAASSTSISMPPPSTTTTTTTESESNKQQTSPSNTPSKTQTNTPPPKPTAFGGPVVSKPKETGLESEIRKAMQRRTAALAAMANPQSQKPEANAQPSSSTITTAPESDTQQAIPSSIPSKTQPDNSLPKPTVLSDPVSVSEPEENPQLLDIREAMERTATALAALVEQHGQEPVASMQTSSATTNPESVQQQTTVPLERLPRSPSRSRADKERISRARLLYLKQMAEYVRRQTTSPKAATKGQQCSPESDGTSSNAQTTGPPIDPTAPGGSVRVRISSLKVLLKLEREAKALQAAEAKKHGKDPATGEAQASSTVTTPQSEKQRSPSPSSSRAHAQSSPKSASVEAAASAA